MNCNTTHYRANSSSVPGDPTQGKVYTGQQALPLGLIDRVCGFEEAVSEAAVQGGLSGERPPVRIFGASPSSSLLTRLLGVASAMGMSP